MIASLTIIDATNTPCEWWPKVEAFQGVGRFDFSDHLTIIWGPNGSGKSTLLRVLARMTHCEQGGTPKVTEESVRAMRCADGVAISTDGKPVHYFDPSARPGLIGGMAGLDDDFMVEAMTTMALDRVSSGQRSTAGLNRILRAAAQIIDVPHPVRRDLDEKAERWLEPTEGLEPGRPTLLLDEPDRSLSIPKAAELWALLVRQARAQVIVATHSVSALGLPARYIDIVPGYLAECIGEVKAVGQRLGKRP